jgi:hypothetical protein
VTKAGETMTRSLNLMARVLLVLITGVLLYVYAAPPAGLIHILVPLSVFVSLISLLYFVGLAVLAFIGYRKARS